MSKTIFAVQMEIPGAPCEEVDFSSGRSLLDADIIVFDLTFMNRYLKNEEYEGKPLLSNTDSFKSIEHVNHWRAEIQAALDSGKTVFVFLSRLVSAYRYTGQKEYSGTGRNQKVTNIVTKITNYDVLPLIVRPLPMNGKEIRAIGELGFLADYWREFRHFSQYEVCLEDGIDKPLLGTKGGERIVAGLVRRGPGNLILLPEIYWDEDKFLEEDEESDDWMWNSDGIAFGKKLLKHFAEIDKAVRSLTQSTPEPQWVANDDYRLAKEGEIESKILDISERIDGLNKEHGILQSELSKATNLKRLLYEKSHELESAIIDALRLMGFKADSFVDDESEFDSVFESPEGRFIGEAEGKDSKAINIDKLSQLERNIQEDFAKENVDEYAKGVLFGNAFRLTPPAKRGEFFTQKCMQGAKRAGFALIRTPDLFRVAQYLASADDSEFAKTCREAILDTKGEIVVFPSLKTPTRNSQRKRLKVKAK